MSGNETVMASKQFHADFAAGAARYMLAELGELEDATAAARRNIDSAVVCFAALALESVAGQVRAA